MPLILPWPLMQIVSVSAWPILGIAAMNSIAAAVVPTIQRHANFEEAGMLTPSIFFCPWAVLRSDDELIYLLLQPFIRGRARFHAGQNPATSLHRRCWWRPPSCRPEW